MALRLPGPFELRPPKAAHAPDAATPVGSEAQNDNFNKDSAKVKQDRGKDEQDEEKDAEEERS